MKITTAQNKFIETVKTFGEKGYQGYCEEVRTANALIKKGLIKEVDNRYFIVKEEKTLAECQTDYKIVTDTEGNSYKVKRGRDFLDLMMKLQRENKI